MSKPTEDDLFEWARTLAWMSLFMRKAAGECGRPDIEKTIFDRPEWFLTCADALDRVGRGLTDAVIADLDSPEQAAEIARKLGEIRG